MRLGRPALLLACTLIAACGPTEPIRIGFIGGLSGRVADLGEAGRNGFQFAVEQTNATGGVQGRHIEILVKDDAQDPAQATRATEELVAAKVVAIIGPMTSAMAEPVLAVAGKAGIPVVSPTVTTTQLTGKDDYFLRVSADTHGYAARSANYHFDQGKVRRVAAVFDTRNQAYSESWLADFRKAFTARGGVMSAEIGFASGDDVDYAGLVDRLLASSPDALLFVAGALDTARFAQAAQQAHADVTKIGVEWSATERLIEFGGKAVDNLYVAQFFDRNDGSDEYRRFRASYLARFQRPPGFPAVAAYDATKAVFDAMWRARSSTPVKQALLETGPFAGAQGPIVFDRFGDSERRSFITVIRDGRFIVLE